MNKENGVKVFFAIVNEVKLSYECPVILLTQKDYADDIFKTLENMRSAILQNASMERIIQIVNAFHFAWLEAVQEVDKWRKRARNTPRETIINSVDYTIQCINTRHKHFEKIVTHTFRVLSKAEKSLLNAETAIIKDMRDTNISALLEKQKFLGNSVDKIEFMALVMDETNELLNWIDRLNNFLALQLCKLLELFQLPKELSETLEKEIDHAAKALKGTTTTPAVCTYTENDIDKIADKIKKLEERITQLREEKSSSTNTLALQHKAIFLEERLESLENAKKALSYLKNKEGIRENDEGEGQIGDLVNANIFNHLLPHDHRCRLVENLVQDWEEALGNFDAKSFITVMRATATIEEFCDEFGDFTVDDYGRKIYKKESDPKVYQLDGSNTLVPVADDENHVYFYDALGRYYLTDDKVRVYKAHSTASEYILHSSGMLLKMKETVDGIEYHYDSLGRYYVHKGDRIYCDNNSTDKYQHDGLGNLVKIREDDQAYLTHCPVDSMVSQESLYLKKYVGDALKTCVAEVVMLVPLDPIKYLAERLEKYHENIKAKEKLKVEEDIFISERERLKALEREMLNHEAPEPSVEEESSFDDGSAIDYNFLDYHMKVHKFIK